MKFVFKVAQYRYGKITVEADEFDEAYEKAEIEYKDGKTRWNTPEPEYEFDLPY